MKNFEWAISDCEFPVYEQKCCTFAFNEMGQAWIGTLSYNFDKYVVKDDATIYGMKDGVTYKLNEGNKISGLNIVAKILTSSAPTQVKDKEFLRIRINSDNKPTKVDFYTSMDEYLAGDIKSQLDTTTNPLALKDYQGFEQYIPRRLDNKNRVQGRVLLFEITHNEEDTEFTLIDVEVQYKVLK